MKLTKSLLLASVAGFAAVASAQAADLPSKKAAPVEYVKVCPTYGPGFFYIPGTDTCLKVGGTMYGEINYGQKYTHDQSPLGTRTSATVSLDARQSTEYGLLRTFVAPNMSMRSGSDNSASANREGLNYGGNSFNAGGVNGLGIGSQGKQMQFNYVAYIQFGGLTVGHMDSFFSNGLHAQSNIGLDGRDQRDLTNTIAYTQSFGNGVSATVGLEDGTLNNRNGIFDAKYPASGGVAGGASGTGAGGIGYGSNRLPDYVANVLVDQSWGKFQVSGMIHSINTQGGVESAIFDANGVPLNSGAQYLGGRYQSSIGTQYGYALQAATKINLPMIATGDYLFASAVWSQAANGMSLRNSGGADNTNNNKNGLGIGRVAVSLNDLAVDANNKVYKPTVMGGSLEFGHQFTPTLGMYVGASYTKIEWDAGAQAISTTKINPANVSIVNLGLVWTPVKGFKITPDVEYGKINVKVANHNGATTGTTGDSGDKKTESQVIGRIKIQRDF
jgi:hypothetical protein